MITLTAVCTLAHFSFILLLLLEVPKSMMKLGELDVLATNACTLSLYPLNFILLPSSLRN